MSLVEFLEITEPVRALMTEPNAESRIREHLKQKHFMWLRNRAQQKVTAGVVAAAEVERYLE